MANLAVVQHKSGTSVVSATTVAVTVTALGTGNVIVVGCSNGGGSRTVTGVSDGTNTYVQAPSAAANANANADNTDIWYCLSSISGPTTVTITFSGSAGTFSKQGEVWEVSGFVNPAIDVTGTIQNTQQTNQVDLGPSVTTTSVIGFIAAICRTGTGGSIATNPSTGNEFSSGGDIPVAQVGAVSLISQRASAHQPSWADGNSFVSYCVSVVAFKEKNIPFVINNYQFSKVGDGMSTSEKIR